ncbi:MAG: class I SAM-dependent methyltransferase [Desulfovibrionaceae bacterium]|nr:class I SAM-dependent methyltransferase [Desulfovibrionaceae bacterium]
MSGSGPTAGEVSEAALGLGRELTDVQARGLAVYLGLLEKWNRVTNLVGKRGWREILSDLVADSWHVADYLSGLDCAGAAPAGPIGPVVFDLGAGAGLPGVPLRLFWDAGTYYLIEPRRKRAAFLEAAIAAMGLARTFAVEARAEDVPGLRLAGGLRACLVVSRAFLPWREYVRLASGLVRPGGRIVVMASHGPPEGGEAPPGFTAGSSLAYGAAGYERYVWSLSCASAPREEF